MSEPSLAQLGIRVDSGDVVEATDNLEAMVDAGTNAERSAKSVESSWASAMAGLRGDTSQIVQELKTLNATQSSIAQQMIAMGRAATDASSGFGAAAKAQAAFATSTESAAQAGQRMAESAEQQSARMAAVVKASLEASQYHQNLSAAVNGTASAMDAAGKSATDWAKYQQEINARGQALLATEERLAQEAKQAAAATDLQADGLQKLLGQIDPAVAALDRLDDQQARLAKYKAAGLLDTETFRDYSAKIDQTRQKLGGFDESLKTTQRETTQTREALRQLPSQFTDIFTSLAGGQNPLLVLIQQGGQIRDSFGGIGPMFEALGEKAGSFFGLASAAGAAVSAVGEVGKGAESAAAGADAAGESIGGMAEGLNTAADAGKNAAEAINAIPPVPGGIGAGFALLAAGAIAAVSAVAAVTYGIVKGGDEADKYRDTLTLTGNAAGKSVGQLSDLARQIGAVNGTVGQASELLVGMADKGKIAADSFDEVAGAAIAMEKATGRSAKEMISEFTKIADDPVKAAQSLNEAYNFLSGAVYQQIASLKEQGKEQEAVKLLTDTYASTVKSRSTEIVENLGFVESAWRAVKKVAGDAVDGIKDLGRDETIKEQIAALDARLAHYDNQSEWQRNRAKFNEDEIRSLRIMRGFLQERLDGEAAIAKAQGNYAEIQRDSIKGQISLHGSYLAGLDKESKKKLEIKELDKQREDALKGAGVDAAKINREYDVALAGINERYKEREKSAKAYTESAGIRMLDQARQQEAVLKQQAALVGLQRGDYDKLGESGQTLVKWEQMLADIKAKHVLTADQKSLLANQDKITAQLTLNAELEKETALRKLVAAETEKLATFQKEIAADLALAQQDLSNQLAGIGMGAEGRRRLQEDLKIRQDYQKKMADLQEQLSKDEISKDRYYTQTRLLEDALAQRLDMQSDYYRKLEAAQANWANGANAAWQDYIVSASDIAGQTYDVFSNAFQGMEDALVEFAMTGKLSFKELANSIIADIARIVVRTKIVSPLLNSLFGGGGGGGGIASAIAGGGSGGGFNLESAWNTVSSGYSVATSGFGQAVSSGWAAGEGFLGGVQGALSSGAGYISSSISGLFSSGSGQMVNGVYQLAPSAGAATVDLIGNTVTNSSGQIVGTASGATTGATTWGSAASGMGAIMGGIGGLIQGYQAAGIKGAVAGGLGGWGGATLGTMAGTAGAAALSGTAMGAAFGSILPGIGTVIGAILGAAFGSKLFGGAWETKDQGYQLGVTDGEFDAYSFEYQKKKGGLFSSNKKRTRLSALDEETQAALDATYIATLDTTAGLFTSLGVELTDSVLDGLNVAATQISSKDRTAEEVQADIAKWFTGLGDAASQEINKVLNVGFGDELNLEYLTGFVNNLYSVNASLKMLRADTVSFDIVGGRAVEHLVAVAGGIEALNTGITKFYDGFTTETQKSIDTLDGVRAQFAQLNIVLPGTREAYAEMLRAIDMTAESGRAQFAAMTANAEQAAAAYSILESRESAYRSAFFTEAENTARSISETTAQLKEMGVELPASRAEYRKLVEEAAKATTESGKAMYDTLMAAAQAAGTVFDALDSQAAAVAQKLNGAVDANFAAVQRSINAQKTSVNDMLATARSNASGLTSISNALSNALKALQGDSDDAVRMLRAQAKATVTSALAIARAGGSLSGFEGLEDALGVISTNDTALYGSLEDFNREQGRNANLVAELNGLNGKQLTASERTVKALEEQLAGLDKQLEYAQAQLDAFNGIDTSIKSVEAAIRALNGSLVAALVTKPSTGAGSAIENTPGNNAKVVDTLYQQLFGRTPDAGENAYWAGRLQSGNLPYNDIQNNMLQWASERDKAAAAARGYATGGFISGPGTGTSDSILARLSNGEYVMTADAVRMYGTGLLDQMNAGQLPAFATGGGIGEAGPVLLITRPAQIYSAQQQPGAVQASGNADLLAELRQLRQENRQAQFQIAKNTQKLEVLMSKWDTEGTPQERDYV